MQVGVKLELLLIRQVMHVWWTRKGECRTRGRVELTTVRLSLLRRRQRRAFEEEEEQQVKVQADVLTVVLEVLKVQAWLCNADSRNTASLLPPPIPQRSAHCA